jgi:hypothetical protein
MKRFFIATVFCSAAGLLSCRNFATVAKASAAPVSVLRCAQGTSANCLEQPVSGAVVDITSPISIFLYN